MPLEVTLFTDDGHWAVVATAWETRLVLYSSIGAQVRVYRIGVPGPWDLLRGPWGLLAGPWPKGPWPRLGPWGAKGPWPRRGRGPWARTGPWGRALPLAWIETPATAITIVNLYSGGGKTARREVRRPAVGFLQLKLSAYGTKLRIPDETAAGGYVDVEDLRSTITIVIGRQTLEAVVDTRLGGIEL